MSSSFFTQIGSDIAGEAGGRSGYSVSLSDDGSIVAIGAPRNTNLSSTSSTIGTGQVRIYQNVNNIWTQLGSDINGESYTDYLGSSVSLSEDGSTVAIGAPGNLHLNYQNLFVVTPKYSRL